MGSQSRWQPSLAMIVYKPAFKRAGRKAALAVLCPTCRVKPGERCELALVSPVGTRIVTDSGSRVDWTSGMVVSEIVRSGDATR